MKLIRILLIVAFALSGQLAFAQNSVIKGIITDDNNNFIDGAKVTLKGTGYEATSDDKGAFEIKDVPFGSYTLLINSDNHTGFSKEIKVDAVSTDVGFLNTQRSASIAEEMMDNVAVVSLSDSELKESSTQTVSGVLNASRDVFNAAAAFTFSAARFRVRGYENENFVTT